jgi:hypothetical protein
MKVIFCGHCGSSKFGLIRHRYFNLQFCSRKCKDAYLAQLASDRESLRKWFAFLAREPTKT